MVPQTPPFPFVPGEYRVRVATEPWELRECARLRQAVFCAEQRVFERDDGDAIDSQATAIAALACVLGMPESVVGTVRIHQLEPGVWQGSRLALSADFRGLASLGRELIRHAVGVASARGCCRFVAEVQAQNVAFFRRLHWRSLGETVLHGRLHQRMEADLSRYPPRTRDVAVLLASRRRAA